MVDLLALPGGVVESECYSWRVVANGLFNRIKFPESNHVDVLLPRIDNQGIATLENQVGLPAVPELPPPCTNMGHRPFAPTMSAPFSLGGRQLLPPQSEADTASPPHLRRLMSGAGLLPQPRLWDHGAHRTVGQWSDFRSVPNMACHSTCNALYRPVLSSCNIFYPGCFHVRGQDLLRVAERRVDNQPIRLEGHRPGMVFQHEEHPHSHENSRRHNLREKPQAGQSQGKEQQRREDHRSHRRPEKQG